MKVTDVKHFLAHPGGWGKNLCFVKVETDEGLYGWARRTRSLIETPR